MLVGSLPWRSTSPPLSSWPAVFPAWSGLHSQPAPRPVWRTDAPSLGGFFPGSSYDLWPSAARCAWRCKYFSHEHASNANNYSTTSPPTSWWPLRGTGRWLQSCQAGSRKRAAARSWLGWSDTRVHGPTPPSPGSHPETAQECSSLVHVYSWKNTLKQHFDLIT